VEKKWYVLYTRPRSEKRIAADLTERGIENYCPLNKVTKKWSDRSKIVLEPLFKGYLLVALVEKEKWDIKNVPGILNFVYWLGKPAVVKQSDVETIRKFLNEFTDVEVTEVSVINTRDSVVIKQGIFMDYKGIVLEVLGNKVKVKIEALGIGLSAIFDKNNLEVAG
jgi:transcription antitermination factor NusG